ncbi:MAG: ABC transporter permease [Devosia sp.]|uniref:ABC transporter permease n=1 Tax=Devosia sp. TaxID=1871048 RepID=UPI001AC80044|nr:ABC transporter permease [Devosia sp.]MBN9317376.1 ABC transporter permease [Devosia sp.]
MTTVETASPRLPLAVDKLGVLIAAVAAVAAFMPFAAFRANRIVLGEAKGIFAALPGWEATLLVLVLLAGMAIAITKVPTLWRLATSLVVVALLFVAVGQAGTYLTPPGDRIARVSPGGGFWLLVFAFALLAADAITRLKLKPWRRIAVLAAVAAFFAILLASGTLNDLSILREYFNRGETFWREAQTHLELALGSLVAATVAGIPIGILCYRSDALRAPVLNVLNAIQTIPSIALFGLLIAPLAWVAANVPGAALLGVAGVGAAPAMVALFAYSLLPVVANTVVGLQGVPPAADDAARGMGMTDWQRLVQVQFPLAFPVILTGIRIVLVQNIGLATIAALIGGGGFGVFVFQGVTQTAMDLVLLGAVPTVALAFAAAVVLDAAVELVSPREIPRD